MDGEVLEESEDGSLSCVGDEEDSCFEEGQVEVLGSDRILEMNVTNLRQALRMRRLCTKGLKSELVRRLGDCETRREVARKKRKLGLLSSDFDQSDATCPCCLDLMRGAIYQCRDGHTVCADCFGSLLGGKKKQCPTCRSVMDPIRNRALESVLAGARMPCKWHSFGCSKVLVKAKREKHEKICQKLAYGCPDSFDCRHVALAAEVEDHLWNAHKRKLRVVEPGKPRFARFQNVRLRCNKVRSCLCAHDFHVFALIIVLTDTGSALLRAFLLRRSNRPVKVAIVKIDGFANSKITLTLPIEDAADLCVDQLREYMANSDLAQAAAFHLPDKHLPPIAGDNKELRLQITFLPGNTTENDENDTENAADFGTGLLTSSNKTSLDTHRITHHSSHGHHCSLEPLSADERFTIHRLRDDDEDDDSSDDSNDSNNSNGSSSNADY